MNSRRRDPGVFATNVEAGSRQGYDPPLPAGPARRDSAGLTGGAWADDYWAYDYRADDVRADAGARPVRVLRGADARSTGRSSGFVDTAAGQRVGEVTMTRSVFATRRVIAAWLVLAGSGFALAADDDFEFAEGLGRRGYADLAAEQYNALINDPKATKERRAEGQYGLATLAYADARFQAANRNEKTRKPMEQVLQAFDAADAVFAKFITENGTHTRVLDAKLTRAKLLQDKAEFVNTCVAQDRLPAGASLQQWQKQVADWFDTALGLLDANLKRARDEKEKHSPGSEAFEDAQDQLTLLWLYRITALYGKGAALPKGDPAGEASLRQAIKEGSDDFQWEAGSTVRGLWAMHYAGLAAARLGDAKGAYQYLRGGIAPSSEASNPVLADVTYQTYREIAAFCLETGQRDGTDWIKEGLKSHDELAKKWPDHLKSPEGQRASLAMVRLLQRAGQSERAMELLQKVVKAAESTYVKPEAVKLLGDLLGSGGGMVGGDPGQLMNVANVKFREEDFRGAIRAYQAVIASCDTPELRDQHAWKAWEQLGNCYGLTQRFYEAHLAFDRIEQAWRKDKTNAVLAEMTNETGWKRWGALDSLLRQTKDPAVKALADRAQQDFVADHPDSPRNAGVEVQQANDRYRDALSFKNDPAVYKAKLEEALQLFQKIGNTSKSYDQVTARIADIHRKLENLPKAIELADAWLAANRPESRDAAVVAARRSGRALALVTALGARADLSAALDKAKDPKASESYKSLLDALQKWEKDYVDSVSGGQSTIDQWRAEALIGNGQVDRSEELVAKLIEANPDAANNAYLSARVGGALERAALEWRGKGDETRYRQFMLRAARRQEWALDRLKSRTGDGVRRVAQMYAEGHEFTKAEALYSEAQKLYVAARDAASNDDDKKRAAGLERSCRIDLINLLVLQEKFDKAIPQLEAELVFDAKKRAAVVARIQKDDALTEQGYTDLIGQLDSDRGLLERLSNAYMKSPSKEHLYGAVNLCRVLELTTKKEDRHGRDWIEFVLRRAEAYVALAGYTKLPEHTKAAATIIKNNVVIPGLVDAYEQELPGSKRRIEEIQRRAGSGK